MVELDELDNLIKDKMKVVLNLIRTNNTEDQALKVSQAFDNLVRGRNGLDGVTKPTRKQGSNA